MKRVIFQMHGEGEDFGPRADGLVTAHSTESDPTLLTVADAFRLATWQDRDDILGSYNDLICIDGIVSCVPPSHASGGINPASQDWDPEPWLFEVMAPEMVRNPNYFTRNVSFMGQRAYFDKNGWPPELIDNFVTVWLEEDIRTGGRNQLTHHEDFQANRSDAGPIADRLIKARYAARLLEDSMFEWASHARAILKGPFWTTIGVNSAIRLAPEITDTTLDRLLKFEQRILVTQSVLGDEYEGSKLWFVFADKNGMRVTHSANATSGREYLGEPVIKEVPTGITQADLQNAAAAGRTAGIADAAAAAAATK